MVYSYGKAMFWAARATNVPGPPHDGNRIAFHRIENFREQVYRQDRRPGKGNNPMKE